MKIGVPDETAMGETRVALVPPVARKLIGNGLDVLVAAGAGRASRWSDDEYTAAGCEVLEDRTAVFDRSDVVLQVRGLGARLDGGADPYRDGQTIIGMLGPYAVDDATLDALADRRITAFALELLPRTGRAQSMDVLTSMASLGGYKAVVTAADALPKLFPMQMTAAGTVQPANVFVVGAGVAGLQAIATAKRLGARVWAYDIRPAVKEEVESLGAKFVQLDLETDTTVTASGYAHEQDPEFYQKQREAMTDAVGAADVVITSAAVPGRPAPTLVTEAMLDGMAAGSVVVDLAAEGGGNCEPTRPGESVEYGDVTIIGRTNLPGAVPRTASQLFANNVANFLNHVLRNGALHVDTTDEIIDATLLVHEGAIRSSHRDSGIDTDPATKTDAEADDGGNDG
ncbi:NAD(P) transhydrogenase subunit alpha [Halogeometricum sp. S1BR25-6]|uniref:proton-translocating NAD(P)(+) transhydrogenase n=1 Tax=Halogeometricum salsisoli TaxID=2950536 RepID=A0ABU2GJT8_9EURY|nr:NAD(P) transhydrogenase subunit alpha [Halogeometricum sp. S1BR25-6]MDS0301040.1 NAD(P) transhydrogenase subunit alpha [Halogeometricum sp. S1BR25-6]